MVGVGGLEEGGFVTKVREREMISRKVVKDGVVMFL
jgi:hypothetical protein